MDVSALGIPSLRDDRLADLVPSNTWHRYGRFTPTHTLYIFRTGRFEERKSGGTLGFYTDDYRLEALWTRRESYRDLFAKQQWDGLIVPDFSLWADDPMAEQIWNVYRSRALARMWQDVGVSVAPNLSWSTKASYEFCFEGIPQACPVAFCQARTIRATERDAFMDGLGEAVNRISPRAVVLYGNASWLLDRDLPV